MTEDTKKETKGGSNMAQNEPVHGRTHNSQNPAFEEQGAGRDISEIDQQEGNMSHGESGDQHTTSDDTKASRQV